MFDRDCEEGKLSIVEAFEAYCTGNIRVLNTTTLRPSLGYQYRE